MAEDAKALGGIPFFVISILFALATGYTNLAIKLSVGFLLCYAVAIPFRFLMPLKRPEKRPSRNILEKFDQAGFPSLHTMRVVVLLGVLFAAFNSILVLILFVAVIVVVALSKIAIKHHYARDIWGGAIISAAIVLAIQKFLL